MERLEDQEHLPLHDILNETTQTGLETNGQVGQVKDAFVVYVQPLKNGLFRIKMTGQTAK